MHTKKLKVHNWLVIALLLRSVEENGALVDPESKTQPERRESLVLQAVKNLLLELWLSSPIHLFSLGLKRFRSHAILLLSHIEVSLVQVVLNIGVLAKGFVEEVGVSFTLLKRWFH